MAECLAPGTLEPPASVAEAVSSLTIADAFVAAGESLAPPPPAPSQRFICSFPDCSANYNKAWKLDAHLCKHTGEVTRPKAWLRGAWRPGRGLVVRCAPGGRCPRVPRVGAQTRSALAPGTAQANQLCLRSGKDWGGRQGAPGPRYPCRGLRAH